MPTARNRQSRKIRGQHAASLDPLDWARHFLPGYFSDAPADFQREMLTTLAGGGRLVARVAPRGHAKSTCVSLAYPLWAICTRRRRNVVIITHESSLARQFVRDIRVELEENERLRSVYPELRRARNAADTIWRDDRLTFGQVTIQARGTGASLRGTRVGPQRPDLIICDDLEKDRHVRSAEQRDALRHWLRRVAIPALAPDGQLVLLGSILHRESLLQQLSDRRRFPRWDYRVYRALEFEPGPDGKAVPVPLWPARWAYERLQEERERIGHAAWQQEYQANPVDDVRQVFLRPWLEAWAAHETVRARHIPLIAVDPATGRTAGDYCAIWIGGLDPATDTLFTYELLLARIGIVEQVAWILAAYRQYRPLSVGIEIVGYQKALQDSLEAEARKCRLHIPVVGLKTTANKRTRIEGLAPLLASGRFRLSELPDEVLEQFMLFPQGRHDDAPDVCAMAVEVARAHRTSGVETVTL